MSFSQDAGLFVHQLDIASDRALLVTMSEADYRAASFLDNRLLQPSAGQAQRRMQWAECSSLKAQVAPRTLRDDAQFIFHIGHVGSTLIARLLGEAEDTLSLREPQVLRQFAELKAIKGEAHSPWSTEVFDEQLATNLRWLSRTFHQGQRSLVKATSFVSDLAPEILQGTRKAVFLTLSPERYLQTILAGENSRAELAALSSDRLKRLHARLGQAPFKLWELDEATRAAMGWACEMTALQEAQSHNVMRVDFDAFLRAPAEQLTDIARFLDIAMTEEAATALVAGPIMQQYSKAPEHGYSPQLREEVLADAARERADDIRAALAWLEDAARDHARIANALDCVPKG